MRKTKQKQQQRRRSRRRTTRRRYRGGSSGLSSLNPGTWQPTPSNNVFTASNYAAANAGQTAGHGYSGASNKVDASSGHANVMKGGGLGYSVLDKPFPITGPYAGYGGIDGYLNSTLVRSTNGFPTIFPSTLKGGGGRGRGSGKRRQRKYTQKGCMRGGSGIQIPGSQGYALYPDAISGGVSALANPMPAQAYSGCASRPH
jgi:hypothetical protein